MKQVLLTLGVLLIAMTGFYWASNRYQIKDRAKPEPIDKEIYLEMPEGMEVGKETEILLKARHQNGKLVSYTVDFNYDPAVMEVMGVKVNMDIFDKKAQSKIEEGLGKVMISGENSKNREKLISGEVLLATLKIKGVKKGGSMIYASRKPEVGVLEAGKVEEGNFQMPNFKVNFL